MSHIYCAECGFQNSEAANFCARCGAMLEHEGNEAEQTLTYTPDQIAEEATAGVEGIEGPALVVRSGGGAPARCSRSTPSAPRSAARRTATCFSTM